MSGLPSWITELTDVLRTDRGTLSGADESSRPALSSAAAARWPGPAAESPPAAGAVTLDVVHAWHLRTVLPLLTEATALSGRATAPIARLAAAHERARETESVGEEEWFEVLEPVLRQVYRDAYGFQRAFAAAYENARAYALANGHGAAGAHRYATDYAELTTEPNTRAFAEANALANARAVAAAYATGDAEAFARTYPAARTRAYARALATGTAREPRADDALFASAYTELVEGLRSALHRAPVGPPP
ncbi:SpcZ [Streptomyces sp. NPDC005732]|uniref:SpcZ n=1 Tax=Streptomyces sp. NPDC005732 TaxID=3157057 RepID=UPI003403F0BF